MKGIKELEQRIKELDKHMSTTLTFISDNPDNKNEQILLDKISKSASDKRLLEWVLH